MVSNLACVWIMEFLGYSHESIQKGFLSFKKDHLLMKKGPYIDENDPSPLKRALYQ